MAKEINSKKLAARKPISSSRALAKENYSLFLMNIGE
jgi:hypothetical protein